MRILYISPWRDFSGYAAASRGYIRALHQAGADVAIRAVRYDKADSGAEYQPTSLEKQLSHKPLKNIDVAIQHVTPNEMRPVSDMCNVAITTTETSSIPFYWAKKLNQFDLVITFSDVAVQGFKQAGVSVPVVKVPHCFDLDRYNLDDVEIMSIEEFPLEGKFIFYNVSQMSHKKGLDVLLRAYYRAFQHSDDVALVIKSYINMTGRNNEEQIFGRLIDQVRQGMKLKKYPPVVVVPQIMTEEEIKRFHKTGDCYVAPSRGEGFNIPAFEALAYGNKLVAPCWGGHEEFMIHPGTREWQPNVFDVDYRLQPVFGQQHGDPDLYTSNDLWAESDILDLEKVMIEAKKAEPPTVIPDLSAFSYQKIGPKMLKAIQEAFEKKREEAGMLA